VALIIEVADTSPDEDRIRKGRIYARARIAVYWIVNLRESQVEVYTQPRAGKSPAYRQRRDYARKESVPVVLDGEEIGRIAVEDFLP
jgi:hypothetical protein